MSGRTLLVMGASSDIGIQLIRDAAAQFDTVVAHYRTMNDSLAQLQTDLGDKLALAEADLSRDGDVEAMIADIKGRGIAPSDIVLLPAPQFDHIRYHKIKYEAFQAGLDISFRSAVLVTQAFLPAMAKKKSGHVVFMLSKGICDPVSKHCAQYVSVKFALYGLMQALASEYGPSGIAVNGLSPAIVDTKFMGNQSHIIVDGLIESSALGRMLTTGEVSCKIRELLNVEASEVNGQNFPMG